MKIQILLLALMTPTYALAQLPGTDDLPACDQLHVPIQKQGGGPVCDIDSFPEGSPPPIQGVQTKQAIQPNYGGQVVERKYTRNEIGGSFHYEALLNVSLLRLLPRESFHFMNVQNERGTTGWENIDLWVRQEPRTGVAVLFVNTGTWEHARDKVDAVIATQCVFIELDWQANSKRLELALTPTDCAGRFLLEPTLVSTFANFPPTLIRLGYLDFLSSGLSAYRGFLRQSIYQWF